MLLVGVATWMMRTEFRSECEFEDRRCQQLLSLKPTETADDLLPRSTLVLGSERRSVKSVRWLNEDSRDQIDRNAL